MALRLLLRHVFIAVISKFGFLDQNVLRVLLFFKVNQHLPWGITQIEVSSLKLLMFNQFSLKEVTPIKQDKKS